MTTATSISRSVVDLRRDLSDLLNEVSFANKQVNITRHGKPLAVIVSTEFIDHVEELEDTLDALLLQQAIDEDDGTEISYEDFSKKYDFS